MSRSHSRCVFLEDAIERDGAALGFDRNALADISIGDEDPVSASDAVADNGHYSLHRLPAVLWG